MPMLRIIFITLAGVWPVPLLAHPLGAANDSLFHLLLEHGGGPLFLLGIIWLANRLLRASRHHDDA